MYIILYGSAYFLMPENILIEKFNFEYDKKKKKSLHFL